MTLYDRAVVSAGQWGLVLLHSTRVQPGVIAVIPQDIVVYGSSTMTAGVYIHPDDADPSPCKP